VFSVLDEHREPFHLQGGQAPLHRARHPAGGSWSRYRPSAEVRHAVTLLPGRLRCPAQKGARKGEASRRRLTPRRGARSGGAGGQAEEGPVGDSRQGAGGKERNERKEGSSGMFESGRLAAHARQAGECRKTRRSALRRHFAREGRANEHRLESVYSQVCLAGHLSTQTHQSKLEIAYSKLASATEAKRRLVSEWASDSEVAVRLSDRHPVSSSLIMGRPCSGRRSRNYR